MSEGHGATRTLEAEPLEDLLTAALAGRSEFAALERAHDAQLERLRAAGWIIYRGGYAAEGCGWMDGRELLAVHSVSGRQLRRATVEEILEATGLQAGAAA